MVARNFSVVFPEIGNSISFYIIFNKFLEYFQKQSFSLLAFQFRTFKFNCSRWSTAEILHVMTSYKELPQYGDIDDY